MNREEAIEFANEWLKTIDENEKDSLTYEFLTYVIHELQQEPSGDAISRQAVEDKLVELCNSLEEIFANIRMTNVDESVCGLCEYDCPAPFECKGFETDECFKLADEIRHKWQSTKDLPPISMEKTAYWILLDECSNSGYYCSECHKKVVKEGWSNTVKKIKFCPNCGAKMEVEE